VQPHQLSGSQLERQQLEAQLYCLEAVTLLLLLLLALWQQLQCLVLAVQASLQPEAVLVCYMPLLRVQRHSQLQSPWRAGMQAASLHLQPVALMLTGLLLRLPQAVLLLLLALPQLQQLCARNALLPSWPAHTCLGQQIQSARVLLHLVRAALLLLALTPGAACQPGCCLLPAQVQHLHGS
jgi:hypothetical protein